MMHIEANPTNTSKMSRKYSAMTTVENANFSSIYEPEIYFDEWTPCITAAWSRLYNEKTRNLQYEWAHLNSPSSTYFLFQIPEKAIHGLLFIDNGKVFFKDHHKGRLSQARIRNSLKGMNIFGAFWVPHQQRLILHDVYMHESQSLCEEVFTKRWQTLSKALSHIENDDSLQGFTLSIAAGPVDENAGRENTPENPIRENAGRKFHERAANESQPSAGCMVLQPNTGLAIVIHSIPVGLGKTVAAIAGAVAPVSGAVVGREKKETDEKVDGEAYITKHTKFSGPESFQIWSAVDNKDLGMPCIQSLKMIQEVRSKLKETDKLVVNVKWNKNLNSFEVVSIK
jgi:hypothetical protein